MFHNIFQNSGPSNGISAALSVSTAPKEIVKICVNQIVSQTPKKDLELRDAMRVCIKT
jgi:hypothetical protein